MKSYFIQGLIAVLLLLTFSCKKHIKGVETEVINDVFLEVVDAIGYSKGGMMLPGVFARDTANAEYVKNKFDSIAAILLAKPPLLLLDEKLHPIDTSLSKQIVNKYKQKDKTIPVGYESALEDLLNKSDKILLAREYSKCRKIWFVIMHDGYITN